MLVPVSEIMKIPSQREKLLKDIENSSHNIVDMPPIVSYQDAPVILQNMDRGNEKNRPFYLSLLMNDFIVHNFMLDSGASSNVMTKKVMAQLNLRISRPYHNICAIVVGKFSCGQVNLLLDSKPLYQDRKMLTLDTNIPLNIIT
jgi:hypothetical protein